MAVTIKRAETERKVRLLAQRTGESLTEAVDRAVEDRLRLAPGNPRDIVARLARWRAIVAELPPVEGGAGNWRDELYDDRGLPR